MPGSGYSSVTDKGFSAFARDLNEGAWKSVSIKKYDAENRAPQSPIFEAPRDVAWKLRATWCIADLDAALGISTNNIKTLDGEWDAAQRAWNLALAAAAEHKDQKVREAASRLRESVLAGAGAEQTTYGYDEEVDFGRQQLSRIAKDPLASDAKKIPGIGDHIKRIEESTEALAKALGRGPGQKRAGAPSKRLREALSACSTTWNAIHDELEWLIDHTPAGKHRDYLEALHAPFLALLERYPARAAAGGRESKPETETTAPEGETNPQPA